MRRFFFLSFFLHGIALMLLFSWEIPLAGKLTPRNIIRVSLIEKEEEKILPPAIEKPDEKPQAEKRMGKKAPAPPAERKATNEEIRKDSPREEKIPKEAEIQPEPSLQPEKQEPFPEPPLTGASHSSGSQMAEPGKGMGEGKRKPEFQDGGGAFLEASLSSDGENRGIPIGGGEKNARVPEGEGVGSEMKPPGPSLPAIDPVLSQIMRRIEAAKRYPRAARKMGIEGKTVVRFKLKPEGQVEAVEVSESSGSDILDKASLETVREAAPLPYKEGWLKVGIVFKIL